ncbi:hypothetical protein GX51_04390 [Blastomyces parvus]|uniref:Uncharacterized protein n=1 Tax=Blastomyces parvus TaxID=2060905 RepID=A0A2B7WU97_9EURO|nr:hypothetical protein GX51_04390 [Blastomyces parvus]
MSKSRMPIYLGLAAAGAGGYYLYRAGGDPKRATRQFENDASRAKSKLRDEGNKALGHGSAEQIGARIDEAISPKGPHVDKLFLFTVLRSFAMFAKLIANATVDPKQDEKAAKFAKEEAEKLDKTRHNVAKDVHAKIDSFDKTVEQKAAEAKSGVSSWFGGKK